jgi:8-oxo-dGTP diphosphatase
MLVKVAAGVILRNDSVFSALRKSNQHQGDLWEFPGGKCESSESAEVALLRELKEECGIVITDYSFFKSISHDYGDKRVELHFFKVTGFDGNPIGREGQEVRWVAVTDLLSYEFPEANKVIVEALMASA